MIGILNSDPCEQSSWEVRMSNSKGVPYYFNSETKQSTWDPPPDLTKEEIETLPGAEHLKSKEKIRASHLLVKHKDSRRPSSWKEVSGSVFVPYRSGPSCISRPISRVRRKKPFPSSNSTRARSTALTTRRMNSESLRGSTLTALLITQTVISARLDGARCKSRLRMRPLVWK